MSLAELRSLMTVDDRLDDVTRARIWSRLDDRIALHAARRRIAWRWPLALAAAACMAIVLALAARIMSPGTGARALVAAPDTLVTAPLGPHARAALVGPARLELVDRQTVRLVAGTLYAEFEGGPGRALRVLAPGGVVIDIVGTLFAIEALEGGASCVSVVHGRVRVATPSQIVFVSANQRWCSSTRTPGHIEPRIQDGLLRHERVLALTATPGLVPAPASGSAPGLISAAPNVPAPALVAAASALVPGTSGLVPGTPWLISAAAPGLGSAAAPGLVSAPAPGLVSGPAARPAPRADAPGSAASAVPSSTSRAAVTADGRPPDVEQTPRQEPGLVPQPAPQQPAPQQPAPQQPAPQQPAPTAEALYREAESALARRDSTAADVALARLLAEYPQSALADQALYERAQLAYRRRAWVDARRHLAALAQLPATPLAEPGRYLVCRIAVETRDGDAVHCLASYRATYPKSAHDRDVLGLLVQLVHARQGCAGARALVDELARRYADSALARAWRATCPEAR